MSLDGAAHSTNISTLTDSRLFFLRGCLNHYSWLVATLHTRHVGALPDATTRIQAKRLVGLGVSYFETKRHQPASLSHTHRAFLRTTPSGPVNAAPHWSAPLAQHYRFGCASRPSPCCRVICTPGATAFSRLWRACFACPILDSSFGKSCALHCTLFRRSV